MPVILGRILTGGDGFLAGFCVLINLNLSFGRSYSDVSHLQFSIFDLFLVYSNTAGGCNEPDMQIKRPHPCYAAVTSTPTANAIGLIWASPIAHCHSIDS